jgi:hypothetical protein
MDYASSGNSEYLPEFPSPFEENMKNIYWMMVGLAVLAGCAHAPAQESNISPDFQVQNNPPSPGGWPRQPGAPSNTILAESSIAMLLKFSQVYAAMSPDLQRRTYLQVNARRKDEYSRMQIAIMALLARPRDDARVIALLNEHLKAIDSRDENLRSLAVLIKTALTLQAKPDDAVAQLTQRLKDEQKRADMLQRKLDELLAVDKAVSDRHEVQPK